MLGLGEARSRRARSGTEQTRKQRANINCDPLRLESRRAKPSSRPPSSRSLSPQSHRFTSVFQRRGSDDDYDSDTNRSYSPWSPSSPSPTSPTADSCEGIESHSTKHLFDGFDLYLCVSCPSCVVLGVPPSGQHCQNNEARCRFFVVASCQIRQVIKLAPLTVAKATRPVMKSAPSSSPVKKQVTFEDPLEETDEESDVYDDGNENKREVFADLEEEREEEE